MLVAPLNWGLGHATRCVPLVKALIEAGFEPVLASDGAALEILKEAFPKLKSYELPGYHIKYSKSSWSLKLRLLFAFFRIRNVVRKERTLVREIAEKERLAGIISDNRFGVYHKSIPSVYITHQLTVLAGVFTGISSRTHQNIIEKFDECWVPDILDGARLSGRLSENSSISIPVKYIGILSRLAQQNIDNKYDVAIVLSGPEPQRTLLEEKVLKAFNNEVGNAILVRGVLSEEKLKSKFSNLEIVNYANEVQLNSILNSSELVVSRSGYSTIMDLAILDKKALFIPTPGQTEQEYLARHMQDLKIAPFVSQKQFSFDSLATIKNYSGFTSEKVVIDLELFSLFHGE